VQLLENTSPFPYHPLSHKLIKQSIFLRTATPFQAIPATGNPRTCARGKTNKLFRAQKDHFIFFKEFSACRQILTAPRSTLWEAPVKDQRKEMVRFVNPEFQLNFEPGNP
jgi:hypothetical protein